MKRVLVVDDDVQVSLIVTKWLEAAGYVVETASTYAEAKARIADPPDVLIVDIRLQQFNGLQLAVHTRAANPSMRVVVISGWDDPVLIREAEACGAVFMSKPFDEKQLLQVLE